MQRALSKSEREAIGWQQELLRDRVSPETRERFAAWIAASSENQAAHAAIEATWSALARAGEDPAILALRHEAALRLTRRSWRAFGLARAAVVAGVIVLAAWLAIRLENEPGGFDRLTAWAHGLFDGETRYSTGTGERLVATLRDGSQITLDTHSVLEVAFNDRERRVRLTQGQAYFEVAKDKQHPFVVEVNNRRLVAVGTAFDVRLEDSHFRVTMIEGTVRVEPASGESSVAARAYQAGGLGPMSGRTEPGAPSSEP